MEFLFQIILVFLLVLLNGFFVASEFALVGVRKTRIAELAKKGNSAAKLVHKALKDLDSFISATQLGITLASLALGWIGEPALAHLVEPFIAQFMPHTAALVTAHTLAITLAFGFITCLHIILGELAPKTLALQRAEAASMFIIIPLTAFRAVFSPFIWFLNGAGNLVVRAINLKPPKGYQLVHSEEEIKMILNQSEKGGVIDKDEAEMVINVFKLGDTTAKEVMVPRLKIIAFEIETSLKELIKRFKRHPHSRFPVFKETLNKVVGFVHIKDIYQELLISGEEKKLSQTKIIRQIIAIPDNKKIDLVLLEMRRKRVHIAIVKNKVNRTVGLISLEDVIESVMGEIEDEHEI